MPNLNEKPKNENGPEKNQNNGGKAGDSSSPWGEKSSPKQGVAAASDLADKAEQYGTKAVKEAQGLLKRYPAQALLVTLGVGILAGFLLSRE